MKEYFETERLEDRKKQEEEDIEEEARKERIRQIRQERLNRYKGRPSLQANGLVGAPIKEPENEAETALLLQAMISSKQPGIDFTIGDHNTTQGVDLIVEQIDKDMPTLK